MSTNTSVNVEQSIQDELPANMPSSFTIEVLKIVKESQQQHGLRHMDYNRYRSFCTRRLRRLRKTLHFVCGNMRRYQKREINIDEITDAKFLLIPLFQAERAWSYAMQLKQEANNDVRDARKRFHLVNRLRKAVKYSGELEKLSASVKCDARTKLEAQGYNSLMNGHFYFELQNWNESLTHFKLVKNIYEKLSMTLKGDESQVFYLQKVEEIVPNIRYCNYKLGDETAKKDLVDMKLSSATGSELVESIDLLISQTKEKQITSFSEVVWRNRINLQIKNEKVRIFLLNVQEYEKQIQKTSDTEVKVSIYENILKESVDAIQLIRDELKTDTLFQGMQRGQQIQPDDKPSSTLLLFAYLTYVRLNKIVERNKLLIEQYKLNLARQLNDTSSAPAADGKATKNVKPQEIVRLYDLIIQNLKEISNLPGLVGDKQYILDNEKLNEFYKTFRAYYMSVFYLINKKYKEAVGFYFRIEKSIQELKQTLLKLDKTSELFALKNDLIGELDWLANELNNSKYKIQTFALLEDSTTTTTTTTETDKSDKIQNGKPLVERSDVYYEDASLLSKNPNVVKLPCDFEPIPCKPIFFDLALNHVELPVFVEERQTNQAQQAGVKGFIKGFFGFGQR